MYISTAKSDIKLITPKSITGSNFGKIVAILNMGTVLNFLQKVSSSVIWWATGLKLELKLFIPWPITEYGQTFWNNSSHLEIMIVKLDFLNIHIKILWKVTRVKIWNLTKLLQYLSMIAVLEQWQLCGNYGTI